MTNELEALHKLPYSQTTGTVTLTPGKSYEFSSFTMTGGTLTTSQSTTGEPLIIIVDGDVSITNGASINLMGTGFSGGVASTPGQPGAKGSDYSPDADWNLYFGGGGNGGNIPSGGGDTGTGGGGASGEGSNGTNGGQGGGSPPTPGGQFGVYNKLDGSSYQPSAAYINNVVAGAGGGSGGSAGGVPGAAGGNGGGSIILICNGDIDLTGGSIITRGQNGSDGTNYAGAGGGGAGGVIVLAYKGTYTPGTLVVSGGDGGAAGQSGGTTGGNGGDGISYAFQFP